MINIVRLMKIIFSMSVVGVLFVEKLMSFSYVNLHQIFYQNALQINNDICSIYFLLLYSNLS